MRQPAPHKPLGPRDRSSLGGSCANAASGVSAATNRKPRKQWVGDMDTSWVKANTRRTHLAQRRISTLCHSATGARHRFERSMGAGRFCDKRSNACSAQHRARWHAGWRLLTNHRLLHNPVVAQHDQRKQSSSRLRPGASCAPAAAWPRGWHQESRSSHPGCRLPTTPARPSAPAAPAINVCHHSCWGEAQAGLVCPPRPTWWAANMVWNGL